MASSSTHSFRQSSARHRTSSVSWKWALHLHAYLLLLSISSNHVCALSQVHHQTEELNSEFSLSSSSPSPPSSTATGNPSLFQIPDQTAFLGRLFYYRIATPPHLHNLSLIQAGASLTPDSTQLPAWLHFNPRTGELFGAPLEKKIYFIQVSAQILDENGAKTAKTYDDIFVIETIDYPAYLAASYNANFRQQQQPLKDLALYECRIELKNGFTQAAALYHTMVRLRGASTRTAGQPQHRSEDLRDWLDHFSVSSGSSEHGQSTSWRVSYQVDRCGSSVAPGSHKDHIYLDQNSEKLLARLSELHIESELVKISAADHLDLDALPKAEDLVTPANEGGGGHRRRSAHHRRRNAYADDPDAYATPTLKLEHTTLLTSTIDLWNPDSPVLSRTLIPSMISPTFSGGPSQLQPTPAYSGGGANGAGMLSHYPVGHGHQPVYPHLYSTPVLMPDMSTLIIQSSDRNEEILATPVLPSLAVASTSVLLEVTSPSLTTVKPVLPIAEPESTSTSSPPPSSTTEGKPTSTTKPNRRPFVNRRIAKLSITAGKYWQYSIPETTFMDLEDGNTRSLRLAFFKDSELPTMDYWIQFDHENQYLYALPTEDNIGKYRFTLVAIDQSGAEVTETLEIYVRQPRESLTYTHRFILSSVSWDSNLFVERIQAVSTLLQRMATQIFEEVSSTDPNEAIQKQTILHSISVQSIIQVGETWTITWSNDTLRRTPCPATEINQLFAKLYDITFAEDKEGYLSPSQDLQNAVSPEFKIHRVKREFIGRSACGNFATAGGEGFGPTRHKEKIVFSNRVGRLGPYNVGVPFKYTVPEETVYSVNRRVNARGLVLSLAPVEPNDELPDWIFFDVREQTIYGLPYRPDHVHSLELQLIAEDPLTGGRETDVFVIDVSHDGNTREDYLFEVTMSFALKNIEKLASSDLKLTAKDTFQVANLIATRLLANDSHALRVLEINRHRYSKIDEIISDATYTNFNSEATVDPLESGTFESPKTASKRMAHLGVSSKKKRRSYHHLRFRRGIYTPGTTPEYFYEFVWTNRTVVTSYLHSSNAYGGGTLFETETCPRETMLHDLYRRLFPASPREFATFVHLPQNASSHLDSLEIYARLFETIEANVEFLSVEWTPKSVCQQIAGLERRTFGAKPIRESDEEGDASPQTPAPPPATPENASPPEDDLFDQLPTQTYLGDKLLTMIIPPIAILTALLFAVTIGCCFHRANVRRKAMGNMTEITEDSPNLYRQRIPIQFEFERGGGPGMRSNEAESMLDSKMARHPIQIMPLKRGMGNVPQQSLPSHHGGRQQAKGVIPGQHMPYQMLPQQ